MTDAHVLRSPSWQRHPDPMHSGAYHPRRRKRGCEEPGSSARLWAPMGLQSCRSLAVRRISGAIRWPVKVHQDSLSHETRSSE